ncbi:MAG: nitroreductase family protein, partial [Eubacterium sp.]
MIVIDKNKCIGCGACVDDCFPMDIKMKDGTAEAANTTCIKCGHCIAVCPEEAVTLTDYDMSEVKAYDADTFDIPSEKLMNFIKFRRSVRHFKDNPIEKEKLEKVIEAGRFTPTGSNKQGVSYIVIRENVRKLTELGLKSLNALGNAILEDSSSPELLKNYGKRWKKWYQNYEENPAAETPLFGNASA